MKRITLYIFLSSLMINWGCSSLKTSSNLEYDNVYFNADDRIALNIEKEREAAERAKKLAEAKRLEQFTQTQKEPVYNTNPTSSTTPVEINNPNYSITTNPDANVIVIDDKDSTQQTPVYYDPNYQADFYNSNPTFEDYDYYAYQNGYQQGVWDSNNQGFWANQGHFNNSWQQNNWNGGGWNPAFSFGSGFGNNWFWSIGNNWNRPAWNNWGNPYWNNWNRPWNGWGNPYWGGNNFYCPPTVAYYSGEVRPTRQYRPRNSVGRNYALVNQTNTNPTRTGRVRTYTNDGLRTTNTTANNSTAVRGRVRNTNTTKYSPTQTQEQYLRRTRTSSNNNLRNNTSNTNNTRTRSTTTNTNTRTRSTTTRPSYNNNKSTNNTYKKSNNTNTRTRTSTTNTRTRSSSGGSSGSRSSGGSSGRSRRP